MSTIVLRSVKGTPLTNAEVDANFTNLNTDKTELGGTYSSGTANGVLFLSSSKVLTTGSALTFDGTNLALPNASGSTPVYATFNSRSRFGYDGANVLISDAGTGKDVVFSLGGSEQMRLTSTGLGIGTSSPTARLDVGGTSGTLVRMGTNSGNGSTNFWPLTVGDGNSAGGGTNQNFVRIGRFSDGTAGIDAFQGGVGNAALAFGTFETERMRLNISGDLGIGTSSPTRRISAVNTSSGGPIIEVTGSGGAGSELGFGVDGTGGFFQQLGSRPISFYLGGSERMRLDSSGNLGLGVTPSAWGGGYGGIQINNAMSLWSANGAGAQYSANVYFDGSVRRYVFTGTAAEYQQSGGVHAWSTAPSGTAGNAISFRQDMTLDASGRLLVGLTSNTSGGPVQALINGTGTSFQTNPAVYSALSTTVGREIPMVYASDTTNTALISQLSGNMAFFTQSTERARIDSSGNFLVGTTTSTGKVSIVGNSSTAAMLTVVNQSSPTVAASVGLGTTQAASASAIALAIQYGNGSAVTDNSLFIYTNGNVVNTNNSYGAISDAKLKENVTDATPKLDKLNQVRIVNFNMIGDEQKQIGVIAQELEQVFPGMVNESPDRDAEGNDLGTTTKSVKYSVFVPMLIKAMQEQQVLIEQLKARLDAANL
jgi:hypothetical protein